MSYNRPIKYRAWTGTEMVAVQTLCFNDKGCLWYGRHPHMGWAFVWPEAKWTDDDPKPTDDMMKPVMQWTGLVDKNGVEIWEGDIIGNDSCADLAKAEGFSFWERGIVRWYPELARFGLEFYSPYGGEGYTGREQHIDLYTKDYWVIGNEHSNPDLLKS